MDNQDANVVVAQGAPTNNQPVLVADSTEKKPWSISRFFISITGEDYDEVVQYRAKARYVTIGFMTLMDPLLSWYLFTMAASLNQDMGTSILIGFATALIIFLIEVALVRTTPLGALYKLFTGEIKGAAIVFFLITFLIRGGIAYALGAINAPRAVVVMYRDGIRAFSKQEELTKREADIKNGRARQDARATQAQKDKDALIKSEQNHQTEMLKGAPGRRAGNGGVAKEIKKTQDNQAKRLASEEAERKITNTKEEAEAAELKKLADNAKSDDYVTMSRKLDKMAKTNPTIGYEISIFHWLCVMLGILAFMAKMMMKPGAYEYFKESRDEQLIAQIDIDALKLTQELSKAKLQESIARQRIDAAEKQILLADPIEYMKKYAKEAYELIKNIQDKGRQDAARRDIDGHIQKAIGDTLDYKTVRINVEEPMPTTT